ncbi:Acid phosphatase type 7 (Purple acid phosphatase long form) [Durusdinium trenchii]|uniref:Acid phosphatase type 7 (Purple acid phosphatase long form) n=1 Tax=Durusdinium trenchii TaxID=1381693 RepID=A0ABP0QWS5_9DINO
MAEGSPLEYSPPVIRNESPEATAGDQQLFGGTCSDDDDQEAESLLVDIPGEGVENCGRRNSLELESHSSSKGNGSSRSSRRHGFRSQGRQQPNPRNSRCHRLRKFRLVVVAVVGISCCVLVAWGLSALAVGTSGREGSNDNGVVFVRSSDTETTSATTEGTTETKQSKVLVAKGGKPQPLPLHRETFEKILLATWAFTEKADVYMLRFAVLERIAPRKEKSCKAPKQKFAVNVAVASGREAQFDASHMGCFVSENAGKYLVHFFSSQVQLLEPGAEHAFTIGNPGARAKGGPSGFEDTLFTVAASGNFRLALMGDSGDTGCDLVFEQTRRLLQQGRVGAVLHVGDMSYATNTGGCWAERFQEELKCQWQCPPSESTCEGRHRQEEPPLNTWFKFAETIRPISGRVPIVTTMGNHDNDLMWFFLFRPPVPLPIPGVHMDEDVHATTRNILRQFRASLSGKPALLQQAHLNRLLAEPYFFSLNLGPFHVVSIQSEDNGINPYERAVNNSQVLSPGEQVRFDKHFGTKSKQWRWLENDLGAVDRSKTPFVIVITHRPLFSSSIHHPNCQRTGDWFKCAFRKLYAPLYEKHQVSLVVSGHSHHYSRSEPLRYKPSTGEISVAASDASQPTKPSHIVLGTGGMMLDVLFGRKPRWVAHRNDKTFGFATVDAVNATHLAWEYHGFLAKASRSKHRGDYSPPHSDTAILRAVASKT